MARKIFSRRLGPRRGVLKTLLIWARNLLLVAVVAVVAAKFYVDYHLGKKLDQWQNRAAPFGSLTDQDVHATFGGDIVVEGFSFLPDRAVPVPPVVLDKAMLHTPGFLFILGFRDKDSLPASLGASITKITRLSGFSSLTFPRT